jgi:hypothetical protein
MAAVAQPLVSRVLEACDVHALAHELAYELARSEIECHCSSYYCRWYDTSSVQDLDPETAEAVTGWVERSVRYLDLRGLLRRHPDNPAVIRILGEEKT